MLPGPFYANTFPEVIQKMDSVRNHYDQFLAPLYTWIAGGFNSAVELGQSQLAELNLSSQKGQWAVDLGAGFGMHSIPLAGLGFNVLAVDQCGLLLKKLKAETGALPITCVEDDLMGFEGYLQRKASLIICMNDTLTHLATTEAVKKLIQSVRNQLSEKGRFIMTFRDYSEPVQGARATIPVRSDRDHIFTCMLDYGKSHVTVTDMLYEWDGTKWDFSISTYEKLRLTPAWLIQCLQMSGFSTDRIQAPSGMVCVVATVQAG